MEYKNITSTENLLLAWQEFIKGKKNKKDVQEFQLHLMDNIIDLHNNLKNKKYKHGLYEHFKINDPKPRDIHKASVRDRLLHHAIYRILYPYFDKKFIHDSYSCRKFKGVHKALNRFKYFAQKVSNNHTKTCWVLKCDIKKFFASVDQEILIKILEKYIQDKDIIWLLKEVINSFSKGLPLGNLTSQLLVNIYMDEFDHFVKRELKIKYYIRYADDFVFLSKDKEYLKNTIPKIKNYLENNLKLQLHPNKVSIKPFASGVDFLGWTHFPTHRVIRTTTKKRMFKKLQQNSYKPESKQSYLSLLSHGDTYKISLKIG
jgi:RNA-directed DNA polymerase